ncbi:DNA binding domain-containing protein, excisionase family [Amycolatopsis arida]|uniref:DNA binding domain-containing protein, excisionase family n=1 Tax=Amycolatopsis arida TaxID=587909 RepID=A0A1I6B1B9_9PSEU|nr:excisionase family DNA binding protein [Amycolatopsis arida]SFQ74741.1 DNA binding domain-containing protein, excisionase family [Amycolatopsis arida]
MRPHRRGAPAAPANRAASLDSRNEKRDAENRTQVRLYTPAEAARTLAVKESWLRRQAGVRAIPCTFLGKHLRFSEDDLREIVRRGRRPPR